MSITAEELKKIDPSVIYAEEAVSEGLGNMEMTDNTEFSWTGEEKYSIKEQIAPENHPYGMDVEENSSLGCSISGPNLWPSYSTLFSAPLSFKLKDNRKSTVPAIAYFFFWHSSLKIRGLFQLRKKTQFLHKRKTRIQ